MLELPDSWVWDFWLAEDPSATGHEAGRVHLFFLYASRALQEPDRRHRRASIGHAVSSDLRHWTRLPDALVRADAPAFDDVATWTGSTILGPDGVWRLFYTGVTDTPDGVRQRIGVATSTDLVRWERDLRGPLVAADPRWYETLADPGVEDEAWRDPWVFPDPAGDGWHMLVTARAAIGPPDQRGVVGHAVSRDLVTWTAAPPLSAPGQGFWHLEVMQLVEIDGRHLLVFSCRPADRSAAARVTDPDGDRGGAIWIAAAASPLGPFDLADAQALTDDRHYVGKLVRDVTGEWALLAFLDRGPDGAFVGAIGDPLPVEVHGRSVRLTDPGLAFDAAAARP